MGVAYQVRLAGYGRFEVALRDSIVLLQSALAKWGRSYPVERKVVRKKSLFVIEHTLVGDKGSRTETKKNGLHLGSVFVLT